VNGEKKRPFYSSSFIVDGKNIRFLFASLIGMTYQKPVNGEK
jgi:hypothetical protein